MSIDYAQLPRSILTVDTAAVSGPFDAWRHSIGHGAINSLPLPPRVIAGARKLKPRLVRVFLQEYFDIYPEHGVFNWSKLDAYLDSFAQTGAQVLATINFKPRVLFPEINQDICLPNDIEEWQNLLVQVVRRYSVERPIVTHWEFANESDFGEWGGCPFRFHSLEEMHHFYELTIQPMLAAFPDARVGGPCLAMFDKTLPFIELCARRGTRLDFVSFHCYTSDAAHYRYMANTLSAALDAFPGARPELYIDEWNKSFPPYFQAPPPPDERTPFSNWEYDLLSVEEMAQQSRRAAIAADILLTMLDTPLNRSFYFLLWDCCMFNREFGRFFSPEGARTVMYQHWNEKPARMGLFSEGGRVRPQYFLFLMLNRLGSQKLHTSTTVEDVKCLATRAPGQVQAMLLNYNPDLSQDRIVKVRFTGLAPGLRRLKVSRIDDQQRWSEEALELNILEERTVDTLSEFEYQFFLPADSILWLDLLEIDAWQ